MTIHTRSRRGFTLLEVLVAMVVLSLGLLGLAGLQAFSMKANQSANFRTQATALANMIVERMRAHGGGATNTAIAYYGSGNSPRAVADLADWQAQIAAQLPDGSGRLEFGGGDIDIHITWTDARWAITDADRGREFRLTTTL